MSFLYVKLDASYYLDDKIIQAGEEAELLYLRCLGFSKQLLNDGLITPGHLRFIGLDDIDARVQALVDVGLWKAIDGGWQIVAWLKHNESAAYVKERSKERSEAGKRGGRASGKSRRNKKIEAVASGELQAEFGDSLNTESSEAGKRGGRASGKSRRNKKIEAVASGELQAEFGDSLNTESEEEAKTETETETETETPTTPPAPRSKPPERAVAAEPALLTFPTDGSKTSNDQEWHLTQSQIDEWQEAYPRLDIMAECREARAWILADPGRRKTSRGMRRFLVGWLGRSQNRGHGRVSPASTPGAGSGPPRDTAGRMPGETEEEWAQRSEEHYQQHIREREAFMNQIRNGEK